jgi:hypothetical protein
VALPLLDNTWSVVLIGGGRQRTLPVLDAQHGWTAGRTAMYAMQHSRVSLGPSL